MVVEDRPAGTLYEVVAAVLLEVALCLLVKAVAGPIQGIFGPAALPLLTLALVLVIHFLSTDSGAALSKVHSGASPDSFFWVAGAPMGIALLLLFLLLVLYVRASLFGSDDR